MNKRYSFEDFADVIATLRSDNGCPWDRAQTHESLKRCVLEEAYEVVSAIDEYTKTGRYNNLCEELGDLMLQSMMHAQIAHEEGIFDMGDVINRITDKMITRHPKVWPEAQSKESLSLSWEERKSIEKEKYGDVSEADNRNELQKIPEAMPALMRTQKMIKKAKKIYNIEQSAEESTAHIHEIEDMIMGETSDTDKSILIGKLLFEVVNIAVNIGVDAEESLMEAAKDYAKGM